MLPTRQTIVTMADKRPTFIKERLDRNEDSKLWDNG